MTFRPVDDNNLSNHRNDINTILIKLKDKREIKVEPENLIYYGNDSLIIYGEGDEINLMDATSRGLKKFKGFISQVKIDSEQVIMYESTKYHFFWMNDKKRISIKDKDLAKINSNSGDYYWVAKANNMGYQQFYENEIVEIEGEEFTLAANIAVIILGVGAIILTIATWNAPKGYIF